MKEQQVIGWREWVGLPGLGIERIKAKVDTGARSSSLHVVGLEHSREGDVNFVQFKVHPQQRQTRQVVETRARVLEFRSVRSSSGKASVRPVILTTVSLLGQIWEIELTLANRDEMGFRMLLGRQSFRDRFLVDAGRSFYGGRPKKKTKKRKRNEDET